MKLANTAAAAIFAFSATILAQAKNEHAARSFQHQHHVVRDVNQERDQALNKRVVEVVTEYQYITVDQDGIPWETQGSVATPSIIQESEVQPTSPTESSSVNAPLPSSSAESISTSPAPSSAVGLDAVFPDGTLACSEFPSAFGAIQLDYLGYSGWTGIQINDADANTCSEGALCSYACPPGYSKSQWPADQPSDGQSRGGLLCQNGKLSLTRPSVSTLCVAGQGSAFIVNNMSQEVAVCRTDYPGTENMVIPIVPGPGSSEPLTVVISADYYEWTGKSTSAQYYVNKAGISAQEGCIWGTSAAGVGNFAPLVFGAGYSNGETWISMFANPLANGADAGYDVKIVASDGSTINGDCSYVNGVFSTSGGCTVCVTSGSANFVFTERS